MKPIIIILLIIISASSAKAQNKSCNHKWVEIKSDTIPFNLFRPDVYIPTSEGMPLICIFCKQQKSQYIIRPAFNFLHIDIDTLQSWGRYSSFIKPIKRTLPKDPDTSTRFNDVRVVSKDHSVSVTVFWKQNTIRVIEESKGKKDTMWLARIDNEWNCQMPVSVDTSFLLSQGPSWRILDKRKENFNVESYTQYYINFNYKSYLK